MEKRYWNVPSIIFNVFETLMLILCAYLLELTIVEILLIFLTFEISRFYFKFPKHYKKWQQCLIWTLLIFTSLFVVARVDITVGILTTIFGAYILSGKADIKDIYMWKPKNESKYKKLEDYIKYKRLCDNRKLIEIEKELENDDPELYMYYKRRFLENKTFNQIAEEFETETARIVEKLDKIYLIFKYSLKL